MWTNIALWAGNLRSITREGWPALARAPDAGERRLKAAGVETELARFSKHVMAFDF